ncbi:SPOR domain-containing protein [Ramlibacter ginsenosidimutans]|uniref:SPOR domain-containing protein n=1 Tax=Ramlibacter ginsenosidimutans TaxID=502333 RepID=A0A934TWK0_9BURK|nr:SPOR domain-containing protein [Ramlibacter ginsenosidimutans]MBK6008799.1 SPOR domain-containing protein [Ramlibacter ginsenosidimutans]
MALFKSRKKKVDEPVAAASPAESIEVMRRRARHRLIGAVVLVLVGVVGFPLLFDTQPRPVAVDIPIEIPDRNKVKPLPPLPPEPAAAGKVTQAPPPVEPAPAAPPPVAKAEPAPAPAPVEAKPAPAEKVAKAEAPAEKKPEAQARAETRAEAKAETKGTDAAKAKALLEGKSVDTAAAGVRYVVQVGAFAEKDKARQAQQKLEKAGLKNYTNVAETKNGTRIRVRAGPFASKAEADQAAQKIKGLDLPAAILTL